MGFSSREEFLDDLRMLGQEPVAESQGEASPQGRFPILRFEFRAHLRRRLRGHEHRILSPKARRDQDELGDDIGMPESYLLRDVSAHGMAEHMSACYVQSAKQCHGIFRHHLDGVFAIGLLRESGTPIEIGRAHV